MKYLYVKIDDEQLAAGLKIQAIKKGVFVRDYIMDILRKELEKEAMKDDNSER